MRRKRRLLIGLLIALTAVIISGFVVGRWTKITRLHLPTHGSTTLRIAVLGDFHIGAYGWGATQTRYCLQLAMEQKPDMILLVGDFVSSRSGIDYLAASFKGVHAPLGVYAVLGNHDHWSGAKPITAALQKAGVRVLINEHVIVRRGSESVALVGIDDVWAGKPDWHRAFAGVPKGMPVVLLSHNPDAVLHPVSRRAQLIVAGHTHAGQIWAPPPLRPYLLPRTDYGRRHHYGLRREGNTWVYITSGVLQGRTPPRWFTRPEVALIELPI